MTRRYALRDDQWKGIEGLLPGRVEAVGVPAKDNRVFVNAVLDQYRAGIPWWDLPERFGPWKAVHTRFPLKTAVNRVRSSQFLRSARPEGPLLGTYMWHTRG